MRAILLVLFLLISPFVCAQESDTSTDPDWIQPLDQQPESQPDWVRSEDEAEEIPHLENTTVAVIAAQAHSFDFDAKLSAIRMLDERFRAGTLNPEDSRALEILSFLALERYQHEVRREGRLINDLPLVRAEAVRLLGAMGGARAGLTIQRVLTVEQDSYVLSVAVRAAAQAYSESNDELIERLTFLIARMNAQSRPDNSLAQSVIAAVNEIHQRVARIDDPDLFRALISIAQGRYGYTVRQNALDVIDLLRRQDYTE